MFQSSVSRLVLLSVYWFVSPFWSVVSQLFSPSACLSVGQFVSLFGLFPACFRLISGLFPAYCWLSSGLFSGFSACLSVGESVFFC